MYRVRIKRVPRMAEGGSVEDGGVRTVLPEVHPMEANIEAEKGETVVGDFDGDALAEHYKIEGKRHSMGGTPLLVPEGSFVFSDTKKLKVGGAVLGEFGKDPNSKKKYTFAELAKPYNVNKYKALLGGELSDKYDRDTAQVMLDSYDRKLAKLALLQEGMKGFPQGVPAMAVPLLAEMGIEVGDRRAASGERRAVSGQDGSQVAGMGPMMPPGMPMEGMPPGMGAGQMPDEGGMGMARYGGLPRAQFGIIAPGMIPGIVSIASQMAKQKGKPKVPVYGGDKYDQLSDYQKSKKLPANFNVFKADWLPQYGYANSGEGFAEALLKAGYAGDLSDIKGIQEFLIEKNLEKGNYQLFNDLMEDYGLTTQGRKNKDLKDALRFSKDPATAAKTRQALSEIFADNMLGARTGYLLQGILNKPEVKKKPELKKEVPKTYPGPRPDEFTVPDARAADIGMPWWQQDRNNANAAWRQKMNLQTWGPMYVGRDVYVPEPTFYDPTRALAANQEAANAQGMYATMFAGPQRFRAVSSSLQNAGNVGNLLAQAQRENTGVDNQYKMAAAELLNAASRDEANARKTYYDEWTTALQQRKNAEDLANLNMLNNLNAGITNAEEAYWVNKMNRNYWINPATGELLWKPGSGKGVESLRGGNPAGMGEDYFTAYKYYLEHADPNDIQGAREYAQYRSGMKGGRSSKDDDDYGAEMLKNYYRRRSGSA